MSPGRLSWLAAASFALILVQGCASVQGPAETDAPAEAPPPKPKKGSSASTALPQTGQASWYGAQHHGKRTASGAIFDQTKLTAAHRSLPFGTRLKVTNLSNGRSVEVEVTDRGPYSGNRIIDLSRAAAQALGMIESGTAAVRLEEAGN